MKLKSLAALVLCATGCVSQKDSLELPSSTKLYVNLDNSKHYSIKKSKEEGERDLVELAKTSVFEEAWIFNQETSTWTECGQNEGITSVDSIRPKEDSINLIRYHIHPIAAVNVTHYLFRDLIQLEGELEIKLKENKIPVERAELKASLIRAKSGKLYHKAKILSVAFPSLIDLKLSKDFKCAVASIYGIMEYEDYKGFNPIMQKTYDALTPEKLFIEIESGSIDQAAIWFTTKWLKEEVLRGLLKLKFTPY